MRHKRNPELSKLHCLAYEIFWWLGVQMLRLHWSYNTCRHYDAKYSRLNTIRIFERDLK